MTWGQVAFQQGGFGHSADNEGHWRVAPSTFAVYSWQIFSGRDLGRDYVSVIK
jgi:hypothetical protein